MEDVAGRWRVVMGVRLLVRLVVDDGDVHDTQCWRYEENGFGLGWCIGMHSVD